MTGAGTHSLGMPPPLVLVVEDDARLQKVARVHLEGRGYRVLVAPDGPAAVSLALEESPAVVLMDLSLPGFDGLRATREIKAQRPDIPVIAVSAYRFEGLLQAVEEAGCEGFLGKPYEGAQLLAAVGEFAVPEAPAPAPTAGPEAPSRRDSVWVAQEPTSVPSSAPRVLVVDDEERYRVALESYLRSQGYRVHAAADGESALQLMHELRPELILLDLKMPGTTGFDVLILKRSNELMAPIPTVVLVDLDDEESRRKAWELGATDFLSKPFSAIEIAARVRNAMRLGQLEPRPTG